MDIPSSPQILGSGDSLNGACPLARLPACPAAQRSCQGAKSKGGMSGYDL